MSERATIEAGTGSAVDACVDAIRTQILGGALAPGERLPPERTLAETLGVNRLTLRSALARLAASRLVSVRQGSGYVVRPWRREGGPDILDGVAALARSSEDKCAVVADLLLVRRRIASAVIERLASGVSDEARRDVAAAVARFAALAHGGDLDAIVAADLDVMRAVAAATGSPVFVLCMNPVADVLRTMPGLREAMFESPRQSVAGYEALLAWLAAPSAETGAAIVSVLEAIDARTLERFGAALGARRARRRS